MLFRSHCAAMSAGWFWNKKGLNALADAKDYDTMTKRINGGLLGVDDRKAKIAKALYEEVDIFDTLLVCGFTKDGQFYLASSEGEIKENLWQFAQAASLWSHLPILPFAKQPNDA